jgi:hypothetical protein
MWRVIEKDWDSIKRVVGVVKASVRKVIDVVQLIPRIQEEI